MLNVIENDLIEFKKIVTDKLKNEVIAFINTKGGVIYVGVDDAGNVVGVNDVDSDTEKIVNMIRAGISPIASNFVKVRQEFHDGKMILKVEVSEGCTKPYYLRKKGPSTSGCFIRVGTSCQQATEEEIRAMFTASGQNSFELSIPHEQNLTFHALNDNLENVGIASDKAVYRKLKVIDSDGKFTSLGLLMSDQNNMSIKYAVYDGITKDTFLDKRNIDGSLLSQIKEIESLFNLNNKMGVKFTGSLTRVEETDYPANAFREAFVNAIAHRNYELASSIKVEFFDDRLEISSPGALSEGLTKEDIMQGMTSCRN